MTRRRWFAAAVVASILLAAGYVAGANQAGWIRWPWQRRPTYRETILAEEGLVGYWPLAGSATRTAGWIRRVVGRDLVIRVRLEDGVSDEQAIANARPRLAWVGYATRGIGEGRLFAMGPWLSVEDVTVEEDPDNPGILTIGGADA